MASINPARQYHGWIGVDFDGTLAHYDGWRGAEHCGEPIPAMVERVKRWIGEGRDVRVFTARVWPINDVPVSMNLLGAFGLSGNSRVHEAHRAAEAIRDWCKDHLGVILHITNIKDTYMTELYDDRCVQVVANTGQLIGESSRGIPS